MGALFSLCRTRDGRDVLTSNNHGTDPIPKRPDGLRPSRSADRCQLPYQRRREGRADRPERRGQDINRAPPIRRRRDQRRRDHQSGRTAHRLRAPARRTRRDGYRARQRPRRSGDARSPSLREREERIASTPRRTICRTRSTPTRTRAKRTSAPAAKGYARGHRPCSMRSGWRDAAISCVGALSGGEKNVLSLTQALLAEPDLLVLDEPGNHLDFAGIAWLEGFLARFRGAVLLISHNRYLLDRVVSGILHLEDGRVDDVRRQLLRLPCDGPAREARAARRLRRRPEAARAARGAGEAVRRDCAAHGRPGLGQAAARAQVAAQAREGRRHREADG